MWKKYLLVLILTAGLTQAYTVTYKFYPTAEPTAEQDLQVSATGLESKIIDISTKRVNLTTWDIEVSLKPEVKVDLRKCWNDINFGTITDCNLTMIRAKYVPPQYIISDTALRTALSLLDSFPSAKAGLAVVNTTTIDILGATTIRATYPRTGAANNVTIGLGTITTIVPTLTTQPAWYGRFTEGTYTLSAWTAEVASANYTQVATDDSNYYMGVGGSATLDVAIRFNVTLPEYDTINYMAVKAIFGSSATSGAICNMWLWNVTSKLYNTLNQTASKNCSANTVYQFDYNTSNPKEDGLIADNKYVVFGGIPWNTTSSNNIIVDYLQLQVSYDFREPNQTGGCQDTLFNLLRHEMNSTFANKYRSWNCDNASYMDVQGSPTFLGTQTTNNAGYNFTTGQREFLNGTWVNNMSYYYNSSGIIFFTVNNTQNCPADSNTLFGWANNTNNRFVCDIRTSVTPCDKVICGYYDGTSFYSNGTTTTANAIGNRTRHSIAWRYDAGPKVINVQYDNATVSTSTTPSTWSQNVVRVALKGDNLLQHAGEVDCLGVSTKYFSDDEMNQAYLWNCSGPRVVPPAACGTCCYSGSGPWEITDSCWIANDTVLTGEFRGYCKGNITVAANITGANATLVNGSCRIQTTPQGRLW